MVKWTTIIIAIDLTILLTAGCSHSVSNPALMTETSSTQAADYTESELPDPGGLTALPSYAYTGDDPNILAACAYFSGKNAGEMENAVYIPAPYILKVEKKDGETLLYGQFWDHWYEKRDSTLFCLSGGENTGLLHLTENNGVHKVIAFDQVRDGDDYPIDLLRICGGDTELYNSFLEKQGFGERKSEKIRRALITQYVRDNQLDIDSYQDFGWPCVPLDRPDGEKPSVISGKDIYRTLAGSGIGQFPEAKDFLDKEYKCTDKIMYVTADTVNARILPSTVFEQACVVLQLPQGSCVKVIYLGDEWSGFCQNPEDQDSVLWVKTEYLTEQPAGSAVSP